jgi:NADH:ubiquinone oxidoreductase subunit K
MRPAINAFLLSALVFPGLGQLYNQDRRKGVFLVLGANLLLAAVALMGLILFSHQYHAVYYPRPLTRDVALALLTDTFTHPLFLIPFALLAALWGFAAVDAARYAAAKSASEKP